MSELNTQLAFVKALWEEFDEISDQLNGISRTIFGPLASELGWEAKEGEPELNKLLRVLVIGEAGLSGDEQVISQAKERYEQFSKGQHDSISPDLRSAVFKIVLKHANEDEESIWNDIRKIYSDESFPVDQRVIALTSLGTGIKSEKVISKTLDLILDEKQVRTQDAWLFFRS